MFFFVVFFPRRWLCLFCGAFTSVSVYYLDVTMQNVHFTVAPCVDSPPLKALPCLFLGFAELLTTLLQPYRPITIWKQWASERDDSRRQQGSYHPGRKRDICWKGTHHNMYYIIKKWENVLLSMKQRHALHTHCKINTHI